MGCTTIKEKSPDLMRMNTVTGQLHITVTTAQVTHETSVFKMDPYVRLKISNQEFESKAIPKGDKNPVFNETFTFHINSCFKIQGRILELRIMDKNKVGADKEVGYGIVDLDPIVNMKKSKETFRCFLNFDSKPAGVVNCIAEFIQETAKTLSFRFQTATLRRKTSTFGNMNCWVQVVIGEEELKTEKKTDTKHHAPTWFNQVVAFNVSDSITDCKISLYDDKNLVGTTILPMKQLLKTNDEQTFNQELIYNDYSAGTLVFQTKVGTNPVFSIIKAVHSHMTDPDEVNSKKQSNMRQSKMRQSKITNENVNPENPRESGLKAVRESTLAETNPQQRPIVQ